VAAALSCCFCCGGCCCLICSNTRVRSASATAATSTSSHLHPQQQAEVAEPTSVTAGAQVPHTLPAVHDIPPEHLGCLFWGRQPFVSHHIMLHCHG
jgi:hypothetical protein